MKGIKKKNYLFLLAGICFLCSLILGFSCMFDREQKTVFADTNTESSFRFTLYNDNTEYKVAAMDRQLTEAVIPAYYNGLPVTEVADNAFMSCTLLENVEIPETVKRVGNNAFYNCRSLKKLVGMINVTEIGNNAFAMCSQLSNLIIPPKVEKLGSSIIRNVTKPVYVRSTKSAITSLNVNWNLNSTAQIIYGNDLVCSPISDTDGNVSGYSIDPWQVLMPDYDYLLLCSYKYRECNGAECLDFECTNIHNEQYFPITNIDVDSFNGNIFNSLTIKYDDEHIAEHYPINVCSQAFMGIIADSINIEVDITLNDANNDFDSYEEWEKGTSMSVFTGSTVKSITLPDSLERIPRSTFALCENLQYIYNTNPYIGANTFSSKIKAIDTSAFEFCTSLEILNIPYTVKYIGNAAFDYWGSTDIKQTINIDLYKSGESWDLNWTGEMKENASIVFKTMPVVFEKQNGTGGSDSVDVTYGQPMPSATAPERVGYTFGGYYSQPKGNGDCYYDKDMQSVQDWNKISNVAILYANWLPKTYNVILKDGITVTAIFGEPMPEAPAPNADIGKEFKGYSYNGKQYYNGDMTSANVWDIDEQDVELVPSFGDKKYIVYLDGDNFVLVRYGEKMPEASMPEIEEGKVFKGYSYNGKLYYNADMSSASDWDIDISGIRLKAEVVDFVTKINYILNGATNSPDNKTELGYGETLALKDPGERRGYVFDGWYYKGMKVTTLHNIDEENITVEARWNGHFEYAYVNDYQITISEHEYVILALPARFYYPCVINVDASVKQLYIYAPNNTVTSYYLNFNIKSTDFNLLVENCRLFSYNETSSKTGPCTITAAGTLNLYTYGTVDVRGCTEMDTSSTYGIDGNSAIKCKTLNIYSADSLSIIGGHGSKGASYGGKGGTAVEADYLRIYTNNVTICGGNGGGKGTISGGEGGKPYSGSIYFAKGITANILNGQKGE